MEAKDAVVKWIYDNALDIKTAGITILVINLIIVGLAGSTGSLLSVLLHLPNILFADVTLFFPLV
jgi:hypothetical protein